MGVPETERAFPRGGKEATKLTDKKVEKKKSHDTLFSVKEVKKSKIKSKTSSKTSQTIKQNGILLSTPVTPLSYKILSEGMLVLGCIEQIHGAHLRVSLPGKLKGRVPLSSISSPYTKQLSEDSDSALGLTEMFNVGQNIVTKVIEMKYGYKNEVILSVNPKDIHSDISHNMIKKGMVLTGAVHAVEDHGFRMDFGIQGVHAFLKNEDAESYAETVNNDTPLGVGQLVRLLVTNVRSASNTTTVDVTADPSEVADAVVPSKADTNPFTVIPGMRFKISVSAVLHGGFKIKWKNFDGFIHQDHLAAPWCAPDSQPNLEESKLNATVLYSVPLVRTVYFTLQSPPPFSYQMLSAQGIPLDCPVQLGQTINSAEVVYSNFGGISLKILKTGIRGFVPAKHVADFNQLPDDIRAKYPAGTKLSCRVMHYDPMDKVFICTMQKSLMRENFLVANELEPGMVVDCKIFAFKRSINGKPPGLLVQIGKSSKLRGFVPGYFVSDTLVMDLQKRFQIGQQLQGKVIKVNHERHQIHVTLRKSLVESSSTILTSCDDAKLGSWVQGVVTGFKRKTYHISFFNDITGTLKGNHIPLEIKPKVILGATVSCKVVSCNLESNTLKLSMQNLDIEDNVQETTCSIGKEYKVSVLQVSEDGIYVKVCIGTGGFGFIPCLQVSEDLELSKKLLEIFSPGQKIKATCLLPHAKPAAMFTINASMIEAFSVCSEKLEAKSVVPAVVKSVTKLGVVVDLATAEKSTSSFIPFRFLSDDRIIDPSADKFYSGQGFLTKIITLDSKDHKEKILASSKLQEFWDWEVQPSVSILESFLTKSEQILNHLQKEGNPLCSFKCGQLVKAKISKIHPESHIELKLENGVLGHATAYHFEGLKLQTGQEINCIVLRVDAAHTRLELSLRNNIIKQISRNQESHLKPAVDSKQRAEVLLSTSSFTLAVLKGGYKGLVVYIPTKKHLNDLFPVPEKLGVIMQVTILNVSTSNIIAYSTKEHRPKKIKKRKLSEEKESENEQDNGKPSAKKLKSQDREESVAKSVKQSKKGKKGEEIKTKGKNKQKNKKQAEEVLNAPKDVNMTNASKKSKTNTVKRPQVKNVDESAVPNDMANTLKKSKTNAVKKPQVKNVDESVVPNDMANTLKKSKTNAVKKPQVKKVDESKLPRLKVEGDFVWDVPAPDEDMAASSSDEDEDMVPKKRLSLAEKRELARKEEARIVQAEQRLMDIDRTPQAADDFDRLVMASPDSSIIWVQYMAFHLQATEIEKARAVAQKALKTISFREEQEKLNVWVALLNLENLYGTQESLEKTLKDALQMNDTLKVYTRMLEIFKESNKVEEGDALFSTMLSKYRASKDVWIQGGTFYYATAQVEKARNLLQKALKSLEKQQHVDVICTFAHLENRFSSPERAHTLFEHVLSSFPRRVDVWCSYVDLLVKANNLEAARLVLERGIAQKIPARKIKVLFKKFLDFEQQHGTDEGADAVRKMAQEYVQKLSSSLPQVERNNDDEEED